MPRSSRPTSWNMEGLEQESVILSSCRRFRRALQEDRSDGIDDHGSCEGWEGITRRGNDDNLLVSELLYDESEFFRRQMDGEQLHYDRRAEQRRDGRHLVLWDLDASMLGVRRLYAIGLILALREADAAATSVSVQAEVAQDLVAREQLESWLHHPPKVTEFDSWTDRLRDCDSERPLVFVSARSEQQTRELLGSISWRGTLTAIALNIRSANLWRQSRRKGRWRRLPDCQLLAGSESR